jgi:hypothetical protein
LQVVKVDCLLCDVKVSKCEEMYANSVKGFKLAQKLMAKLVKQLACMKVGSSPYFQPLLISRPPPKSRCIKSLNVWSLPSLQWRFWFPWHLCRIL